jgi:hypothetical protein
MIQQQASLNNNCVNLVVNEKKRLITGVKERPGIYAHFAMILLKLVQLLDKGSFPN